MKQYKVTTTFVALLTFCATLLLPVAPAYAFSLSDILPQPAQVQTDNGGGSSLVNLLLGLLLGKVLDKSVNTADSSPMSSLSRVLSAAIGPKNTTGGAVATGSTSSVKGQALINTAKKYMGVPYVWGGTTTDGFDCSGFTQYVMKENGITIPRTAAEQFAVGTPVDKANLQTGDLIFFTTYKPGASHVGFYIGDGKFIHASSAKAQVTISDLNDQYYTDHYIGARRYI